ncbi:MAG: hypothetical protein H7Z37_03520 [Pyrinomonadaceae bacterium]|nr:hypothetical protein [Pyrinomonadaceae bacterium]
MFFVMLLTTDSTLAQGKTRKSESVQKSVYRLTREDKVFLEDLERRAFRFFWEHSDAETGLTLDRARTNGDAPEIGQDHYRVTSIASTGFALSSYCIAAESGWENRRELKRRTRKTLEFFANRVYHKNGWFYHWLDQKTGERRWNSEISSIDTALLLGGVLTVRQCFREDKSIVRLATLIYNRVDFQWMLNGDLYFLSHGWRPENGWIPNRWNDYSEQMILYLLGIGSPTHSISPLSWYKLKRDFVVYKDYRFLAAVSPLFIHQYSHAFVDFRGKRERYLDFSIDYFANSVVATRAQRQFFIDNRNEFPEWSENVWGLTASDSAGGYKAWGAPPRNSEIDGTVVPCAAGGSLMFAPDITLPALKTIKEKYGNRIYGRYGFTDAFNPQTGWVNGDVIGIDVGITLLSAENLRTGKVWQWFMQNPEPRRALRLVRLR